MHKLKSPKIHPHFDMQLLSAHYDVSSKISYDLTLLEAMSRLSIVEERGGWSLSIETMAWCPFASARRSAVLPLFILDSILAPRTRNSWAMTVRPSGQPRAGPSSRGYRPWCRNRGAAGL